MQRRSTSHVVSHHHLNLQDFGNIPNKGVIVTKTLLKFVILYLFDMIDDDVTT